MKRWLRHILFLALFAACSLPGQALTPGVRNSAEESLREGRADDALKILLAAVAENAADPEAHALLCRAYSGEERWDEAIRECQQSVALDGHNSNAHLWLGRAEGEKADRVSFVTAYSLGKKVHTEFEKAVMLDPSNVQALSDLGEFYTEAPPLVGGGSGKAQTVADRLDTYDRARAEELRGRIAVSEKNLPAAEQHFRAAIATAHSPAAYWMVLASFYARQRNWEAMNAALESGIAADTDKDAALVDAAHVLLRTQRDPERVIQLLESYLASANKSADEPAYRVHVLLGKVLEAQGRTAEAQQQFAEAAGTASGYHPGSGSPTHSGR